MWLASPSFSEGYAEIISEKLNIMKKDQNTEVHLSWFQLE